MDVGKWMLESRCWNGHILEYFMLLQVAWVLLPLGLNPDERWYRVCILWEGYDG